MPTHYTFLFFFDDPPPTEIYTLSLHDALPISVSHALTAVVGLFVLSLIDVRGQAPAPATAPGFDLSGYWSPERRSEEHTSELQSQSNLVCRLLLEKKKKPPRHLSPDPQQLFPR